MTHARVLAVLALAAGVTLVACEEEDPGPYVVEGWIARCRDACDQMKECSYQQLLFYHGDLDNCKRTCGVSLEREVNLSFIDETPVECLDALYAELKCIYGQSCTGLESWKLRDPGYPCEAEGAAVDDLCSGTPYTTFRDDCEYPVVVSW